MISFIRVDDRIIHGQIVTRWSKEYPCDGIIAVNDKAATTPVLTQSFKASTDKKVFVWTKEHIEGHFMSCFISLVIEKYLRHVLKSKFKEITNDEINTALRTALLAYDNGNPQVPMYLRLYSSESRFDDMLRTFGLEPPCRYETPMSLRKKLRLKTIYSEKPKA